MRRTCLWDLTVTVDEKNMFMRSSVTVDEKNMFMRSYHNSRCEEHIYEISP